PPPGLLLGLPAPHLPRRRHGQERDRGQLVRAAGPRHRPDRRRAERPAAGPRRRGGHHHRLAAARPRRRRARHGQGAGPARPARPGGPAAGPGPGADHLPGGQAGLQAVHLDLVGRHLAPEANPARMALFDLSSSWLEGRCCPLAARGYSRDGKKGKLQIEYGLLTDPAGRPVAVRVFPGNTGDPSAFTEIADVVREKFGLAQMVMVGDRGMITSARIAALNQLEDGTPRPDPYGWITALRAPAIRKLMAAGEKLLAPLLARVQAGRLAGAGPIGVEAGKVISRYKTGKHFAVTITD